MIRRLVIRRFKRLKEETFDFPGHIVLAGPNNCGKTTVLQAIAAWDLSLRRWRQLHDDRKHNGAYAKAPLI
jgi:recombinational DNA repair ATPase RecF